MNRSSKRRKRRRRRLYQIKYLFYEFLQICLNFEMIFLNFMCEERQKEDEKKILNEGKKVEN